MFRLTACFSTIVTLCSAAASGELIAPPPAPNEIALLQLSPGEVPLAALAGQVPVTAVVSYALDLADTATVQLETNASHPAQFTRVAEVEVKRGRGTVTLSARVTIENRNASQPLMVRARFAAPLRDGQGHEFVSRERSIPLGRRTADSVDGIVILGCDPEQLVIDREQEVAVLVSYDLKTAAKGEINLGFNARDPNAYSIFASRVVEKGSGQIVITARVRPRSWGEKVFFKAYVNLSEHPHASPWSPLANDSEPLELTAP